MDRTAARQSLRSPPAFQLGAGVEAPSRIASGQALWSRDPDAFSMNFDPLRDVEIQGQTSMAYPITDIPGMGTDVAALLKEDGIRTTVGFLRAAKTPKQRLKMAAKTGTDPKRILDWATACDRMRVKGIGAEYAELLGAAGVRTVNDLQFRNPRNLVERMQEANKDKRVRLLPKEKTIERWIEDAKKLPPLIRY
jgi:predicted flap endonuclease-1-like 5' DNA nuclease